MNTLLLIDDNLDCARIVSKILTPSGYTIEHAATGLGGLQLARCIEPNIVLVDINLPDLNGHVVVNQLRGSLHYKCIPIIAFTAESGSKAKRIAIAIGCNGFLSKPIDTRMFPGQIEAFLSDKHLTSLEK